MDANDWKLRDELGVAYGMKGDYDSALRSFQTAIRANPAAAITNQMFFVSSASPSSNAPPSDVIRPPSNPATILRPAITYGFFRTLRI